MKAKRVIFSAFLRLILYKHSIFSINLKIASITIKLSKVKSSDANSNSIQENGKKKKIDIGG
ncbi:MAG: hypothetical protein QW758_01920 [Candidatus Aenigmatarchaeota archaeon]